MKKSQLIFRNMYFWILEYLINVQIHENEFLSWPPKMSIKFNSREIFQNWWFNIGRYFLVFWEKVVSIYSVLWEKVVSIVVSILIFFTDHSCHHCFTLFRVPRPFCHTHFSSEPGASSGLGGGGVNSGWVWGWGVW